MANNVMCDPMNHKWASASIGHGTVTRYCSKCGETEESYLRFALEVLMNEVKKRNEDGYFNYEIHLAELALGVKAECEAA